MKIGKLTLKAITLHVSKSDERARKEFRPEIIFESREDIPYIDDGNDLHRYDLHYADKTLDNYKSTLVIDIHGGGFIFGYRKSNFRYGYEFLRHGYDFASIDYLPMSKDRNMGDLIEDCAKGVKDLIDHKEEYGLAHDKVVLTGDSAGGLMALILQMANDDPTYAASIGIDLSGLDSKALVVCCPVFDLVDGTLMKPLSKGGKKYMFGERYADREYLAQYSPSEHMQSLRVPTFVSTCKNDFIRHESEKLMKSLAKREDLIVKTVDLQDTNVGHVHNVVDTQHPDSVRVNEAIMAFLEEVLG